MLLMPWVFDAFAFSVEFGAVPSVWNNLASVLDKVVKDGLDPEQVEQIMLIFRIIRNSAAGVTNNQDQARYKTTWAYEIEVVFNYKRLKK